MTKERPDWRGTANWTHDELEYLEHLVLEMEESGDTVTSIARKMARTRSGVEKQIDHLGLRPYVVKHKRKPGLHPNEHTGGNNTAGKIPYMGHPAHSWTDKI